MTISLRKNMGIVDRTIRGCLGTALAALGVLIVQGTIGLVLVLLSASLLLTAITGFCPTYVSLGMTTRRISTRLGQERIRSKGNDEIPAAGIEALWLMPHGTDDEGGYHAKRART